MSAPVVSGTIALMLQANPALTPNAVKAILQYTAAVTPNVDALSQGAGFLNGDAAVSLARFYAASPPGRQLRRRRATGRVQIIWGNRRSGGVLQPWGSAWGTNIIWGSTGDNIIWGSTGRGQNIIWGSSKDNIIWGHNDNIIWGSRTTTSSGARTTTSFGVKTTSSGAATCLRTAAPGENIIWGSVTRTTTSSGVRTREHHLGSGPTTSSGAQDNIIWGSGDNIIWGSSLFLRTLV